MELSKEQYKLLDQVASDTGFSDYEIIAKKGSSKGDNFLGIITCVTIKNKEKSLDLILKSCHTNKEFRKVASLRHAYTRELYLYDRIFSEFEKFQEKNNISNPFVSVPKAYATSSEDGHEYIVMEDLKAIDYQLWDKSVPMDSKHVTLVLKEYAKLHAISFAMKEKEDYLFREFSEELSIHLFELQEFINNEEKLENSLKLTFANGYRALKDDPLLTECLYKIESSMKTFLREDLKNPDYKLVVSHGDCWCNNFLFKYENFKDKTTPVNLRILDWQLSSLTSPAYDIVYFLIVNSSKEILDDFKRYLNIYYDAFCVQLRNFKCDPEKLFSFSMLEEHLNKFMVFGVNMALNIVKIMLSNSEEAPDFEKISENVDLTDDQPIKKFDDYKERIKNILQFVKDNNYV